ncbi:MAG: prolyl oligopeptidase family serine peptidase [Clostridia bacterium]|nr:prolyl oligopeptidase family serine peptidase [Clostridia bacterium]MBQ4157522.1 prolyl oligopeptidase family serine peptidase [Clostridia bacterium]
MIYLLIIAALIVFVILPTLHFAYTFTFHVSRRQRAMPLKLPNGDQYKKSNNRTAALISELSSIPYEEVTVTSFDGLRLYGRYYHFSDTAPLHIQFHGYRGNGLRDFCGGNKIVRDLKHNSIVVDQRAIGKSEGHDITFGVREREDIRTWTKYAYERFGKAAPIFISGVSMGAASVLMASEFEMPGVIGVIADCPYTSPKAIIKKVSRGMHMIPSIAYPITVLSARLFGRFRLENISAAETVKNTKYPILIIHGEDDRFVPVEMSREIHAANPSMIQLETFPGAGHGICYMEDTKRYEHLTREFIERCLANKIER